MPFDGNGNWTADFSAVADKEANIKIMASRFDNIHQADLKESFENCLTKDMQVKPLQNFNANSFRIINVANPVQDTDAVNKQTLESRVSTLLSTLYPVGAIYIGTQSTCPLESIMTGSVWAKIEGRYLLASGTLAGTSEAYSSTNTVSAGLPNHKHKSPYGKNDDGGYHSQGSNSPHPSTDEKYTIIYGYGKDSTPASESNAIYGASDTVRPPSYVVNVWRRTA